MTDDPVSRKKLPAGLITPVVGKASTNAGPAPSDPDVGNSSQGPVEQQTDGSDEAMAIRDPIQNNSTNPGASATQPSMGAFRFRSVSEIRSEIEPLDSYLASGSVQADDVPSGQPFLPLDAIPTTAQKMGKNPLEMALNGFKKHYQSSGKGKTLSDAYREAKEKWLLSMERVCGLKSSLNISRKQGGQAQRLRGTTPHLSRWPPMRRLSGRAPTCKPPSPHERARTRPLVWSLLGNPVKDYALLSQLSSCGRSGISVLQFQSVKLFVSPAFRKFTVLSPTGITQLGQMTGRAWPTGKFSMHRSSFEDAMMKVVANKKSENPGTPSKEDRLYKAEKLRTVKELKEPDFFQTLISGYNLFIKHQSPIGLAALRVQYRSMQSSASQSHAQVVSQPRSQHNLVAKPVPGAGISPRRPPRGTLSSSSTHPKPECKLYKPAV
ncbi:hypothetical protein BCR34DRAFT_590517 [Clohesyomyces aquaticus]|uniref:Uncharacterized protein n=1 Tax=Clohesyomyces aquaticus TaxID=1231657 RepID=A0A1Y1Z925_9PLEO|nr:hypothetical protein BCR34DRAFT_590517 [Clohesyomyces aquaticus]